MKKRYLILLSILLAAVLCLGSCGSIGDAASDLAGVVVSSVGDEISSAISEGAGEFSDGINELKDGISDIKDGFDGLKEGLGDGLDDLKEGLGDDLNGLKEDLNDASENIKNAGSIVSDRIGDITDKIVDGISSELSEAADNIAPSTSTSSDDTTSDPAETKEYTFRTQKQFDEHYEKHGAEFGDITQEQYLALANELINSTSDSVLHKRTQRTDGDKSYDSKFFDKETGYFLVLSEDGYIRTFFIPSAGINYWNRQ